MGAEAARRRRTVVRKHWMLPLLPGKSRHTPLPLCVSTVAGPVTSPCWPCTALSPFERVWLTAVKNTFSPTL